MNIITQDTFDKDRFISYLKTLTPISEIAILMDIPESILDSWINDPENELHKVYKKTIAEIKLNIRKHIISCGSSSDLGSEDFKLFLDTYSQFLET